jgi:hypothetical protein
LRILLELLKKRIDESEWEMAIRVAAFSAEDCRGMKQRND